MNKLTLTTMTMSSREIAELTGKEHSNVLADVRIQFAELYEIEKDDCNFNDKLKQYLNIEYDNRGYMSVVNLNKEQTYTLIAGYNVKLRHAIIKRWQELEAQQQPKLPTTYIEALENLLATEKERARLESINNALMHVSKLYNTTEIAKELGFRSGSKLNNALRDKGIQYKTGGTWVLYAGYSEMDLVSIKQDISPSGHTFYDRRWTQKGREFILALFGVK